MKKFLITTLFCFTFSFGQTGKEKTSNKEKVDSVLIINSDKTEALNTLKYRNEILEERLKQASDTINNQNSLVSGFSIIYTIITIIIALLGISLPILTYLFGIRPSQKALSDFEKNIDQKMGEYLENSRNNQIDQSIENLSGNNQESIISAINFLSITNYQGFREDQIFKIVKVLRENNLDETKKGVIANLLSSKKNIYTTDYFKYALTLSGNLKGAAIKYFANYDISENINLFRTLLLNANDKNAEFFMILTYSAITNRNAVIILLNDTEFVDAIDQNLEVIIKSNFEHGLSSFAKGYGLTENEIKETYLFKKLN